MNARGHVTGVILAAGPSARFAGVLPKQLVPFAGEPMLRRVVRRILASRVRQVLVVVGHRGPALAAILAGLAVELVDNRAFAQGQSTSVRCALPHVEPAADAALFIPADQPCLTPVVVDSLISAFERSGAPIVVPTAEGRRGSPVLISRSLFHELSRLEGDAGGRQIFASHEADILEVPIADALALRDIDTWGDYEELLGASSD
ncbi:MAG: nucleotidyltransferase family protein [Acidobacteriota bacterium]|nr:nucleotidyltransferase family protein [Acidobacteriota bacterium]